MNKTLVCGYDNDDGRSVDGGRSLGSFQNHIVGPHVHNIRFGTSSGSTTRLQVLSASGSATAPTTATEDRTGIGDETRPRNIALLACIKY